MTFLIITWPAVSKQKHLRDSLSGFWGSSSRYKVSVPYLYHTPSLPTTPNPNTLPKMLKYEEVAKHNSKESCWVIVHGEAYDV